MSSSSGGGDRGSSSTNRGNASHPLDQQEGSAQRRRRPIMQWSIGLLLVFTLTIAIVAAGVGYLVREDADRAIQYVGLGVIIVAPGILLFFLKIIDLLRR